jgi:dihydrofolate reductase
MYLTWVSAAIDGADTFFPGVHFSDWTEVSRVHHKADADHAYDFDMVEYLRSA